MMRFPSVGQAWGMAREAAVRFPFVILSGTAAAILAVIAVENGSETAWLRATLAALLGLPLFILAGLVLERRPGRGLALRAVGLLLPLAFFLGLDGASPRLLWLRFAHLAFALHLCVAIVPFLGRSSGRGFWQFNRVLFLRFLVGALFTVVLFGGLALAIAALEPLFGVRVEGEIYPRLFFVLAFLFSPWFFAAGVPRDLDALERREDYPAGLRVFAQFVLIPLVTVYLLLLTTYLARVLLTRTWPSGWIGWLVSGVAVTGTLALLLVHPLRERDDSRWVDGYGRWFYVALLPSIGMLLAALAQRIGQYGITEPRFHLLVLAVALAGIAVFYGVTASRDIRVIPGTLAAAALLTFVGPISAYAFTERSQRHRIEDVLERHGLLVDGRAVPADGELPFEDRRRISGALRYLLETRGTGSVRGLLVPGDMPADSLAVGRWQAGERAGEILAALNIEYTVANSADGFTGIFVSAMDEDQQVVDVAGWDWLFETSEPSGTWISATP